MSEVVGRVSCSRARREFCVSSKRVTDAELAVLQALWNAQESGECPETGMTIRQITDAIYPQGSTSDYATVQKLLERLESKECVRRDRSSFAHSFLALASQDDLISSQLEEIASKMFEGSMTPLLIHLVKDQKRSSQDRDELRRLLDDAPKPGSEHLEGERS